MSMYASSAPHSPLRELVRWTVGALMALLLGMGMILLLRRIGGGLAARLDAVSFVFAAGALVTAAVVVRVVWFRAASDESPASRWTVLLLPTAVLLLFGVSLLPPDASTSLVVLVCLLVAVEEAASLMLLGPANWRAAFPLRRAWNATQRGTEVHEPSGGRSPRLQPANADGDELPPGVTQQLSRFVDGDGREALTGQLRASFQPGQRQTSLHVAFCPPFAFLPHVAAEQTSGADVRITISQVHTYGTKLELRLSRPSTSEEEAIVSIAVHTDEPASTTGL